MIFRKIDTAYVLAAQLGGVTVGLRRRWVRHPVYAIRNKQERSVYAGVLWLYIRIRL